MASLSGLHLRSRLQKHFLLPRLRQIRLLVCDLDGMLTDGGLHYDEEGRVVKRFDVRDGLPVRMLQRAGIIVALLSGVCSGAIKQRAWHLDIQHCRVGVGDKQVGLEQLRRELGMACDHTAFLGVDLNDLVVRPVTVILIATADADDNLRRQADWVLRRQGGQGAPREVSHALLASNEKFADLLNSGWKDPNG